MYLCTTIIVLEATAARQRNTGQKVKNRILFKLEIVAQEDH